MISRSAGVKLGVRFAKGWKLEEIKKRKGREKEERGRFLYDATGVAREAEYGSCKWGKLQKSKIGQSFL